MIGLLLFARAVGKRLIRGEAGIDAWLEAVQIELSCIGICTFLHDLIDSEYAVG